MAAISEIGISNLALASIGEAGIRSFEEDNKRSRMCKIFYDYTRDFLLSRFNWSFARCITTLNQVVDPPCDVPDGYYAFLIPSTCLTPISIFPYNKNVYWEVIGEYILSNVDEFTLLYTKKEIDYTLYSNPFANVLAMGMAARLAMPVVQSKSYASTLFKQFQYEEREAWQYDAQLGGTYPEQVTEMNQDTFVQPYSPDFSSDCEVN